MRILVVENRKTWRDRLKRYLESEGYAVETAASYGEALGRLQHSDFDLAVVDLKLGADEKNLDGVELLDDAAQREIPAIVVSGRATVGLARRVYADYDVVQFIDKQTFDRDRFVEIVEEALNPAIRAATLLTEGGIITSIPPELDSLAPVEMDSMVDKEIASIARQLQIHKRNLFNLEEQKALYGMNPPLYIINGIAYEQKGITEKETRLKDLLEKLIDRPIN